MLDGIWRLPARLWRRRIADTCHNEREFKLIGPKLIGEGSLEEMILSADAAHPEDKPFLLIACDGLEEPLAWPQIQKWRCAPDFPIDI